MKTKGKTIVKGEIQRTKGKLYMKTKEEEKLQTKRKRKKPRHHVGTISKFLNVSAVLHFM